MSKELKLTKENVLKAAEGCADFKMIAKILWPKVFEEKGKYKIGDRFIDGYSSSGVECILAQVAPSKVSLITLSTGNRYAEPFRVVNVNSITENEFGEIVGKSSYPHIRKSF